MDLVLPQEPLQRIVTCTVEGILEHEDLQQLLASVGEAQSGEQQIKEAENPADLKRLRERHHSVARLIAQGMSQRMVASLSNYTESYLSILLNNPAMQELVEMYRLQHTSSAAIIGERLRTVGTKALEKLDNKLEGDAELDVYELTAIAKLGLDRSGHGPTSTQHVKTETHLVDHARLAELNRQARKDSAELIVPINEVRKALEAPKPAEDDAA